MEFKTYRNLKKLYIYRKQRPKSLSGTFELGYVSNPKSGVSYNWDECNNRVCEGFWGDKEMVHKVTELLNDDPENEIQEQPEFTKKQVTDLIHNVLESAGGEIKTTMEDINISKSHVVFDGHDLQKWIDKNI